MTRPDHIARMVSLDPSETASGYSPDATARQVQDLDRLPQAHAAAQREADRRADARHAALLGIARAALIALAALFALLVLAHVAPIAAHHIAFPAEIQH